MAVIAESAWLIVGDIGGQGITRFRWNKGAFAAPTAGDCAAALTAQHTLISTFSSALPADITWVPQGEHRTFDPATGLITAFVNASSVPASVAGSGGGNYAAGIGCRIDWRTSTVLGRRLLRSASFIVPMASTGFHTDGAVSSSVAAAGTTAADQYLLDMVTAGLAALAWHRPPKGTFAGGVAAPITSGSVSFTPSGLRSRRS